MRDPWLRWAVLLALAIVAVSCNGDGGKNTDPAVAAGDVREVTGTVTATRDGKTRALAMDDEVAAGDLVTTGPDGDVVIELRHNHVRWHLGADQARTPMEAAAWSAPPPMVGAVSGDRTAVAGRHAEKSAAQTTAGAVPITGGDTRGGGGDDHQKMKGEGTSSGSGSASGSGGGSGSGSGSSRRHTEKKPPPDVQPDPGCDEVACVLAETPMACCSKYTKRHPDPGPLENDGEVPDTLGRDDVTVGIEPVKEKLLACGEQFPDEPAHVRIKVKVKASGSVSSVKVVDDVDPALATCLDGAVKRAKFRATGQGGTFTFPAILR